MSFEQLIEGVWRARCPGRRRRDQYTRTEAGGKGDAHGVIAGENTTPDVIFIPPLRRPVDDGVRFHRHTVSAPHEVLKVYISTEWVSGGVGDGNSGSVLQALGITEESIVFMFDSVTKLLDNRHKLVELFNI